MSSDLHVACSAAKIAQLAARLYVVAAVKSVLVRTGDGFGGCDIGDASDGMSDEETRKTCLRSQWLLHDLEA